MKEKLRKVFYPPLPWIAILAVLTIILLRYVFSSDSPGWAFADIIFIFSAYSFTVFCLRLPDFFTKCSILFHSDRIWLLVMLRQLMEKNRYTSMYLHDREFRAHISLYTGFFINGVYALLKGVSGLVYRSQWLVAIGVYYLILGSIRFFLLHSNRNIKYKNDAAKQRRYALVVYQRTGIFMLVLDLAMVGMLVQMVYKDQSYEYPGVLIYLSALYTFYYFITAIISMVRFANSKNPIIIAAKKVSFVGASMSLLSLQTAMLMSFSNQDASFNRMLNSANGGVICTYVIGLALFMIVRSTRELHDRKLY